MVRWRRSLFGLPGSREAKVRATQVENPSGFVPGQELDPEIALFRRRAAEATRHLPPLGTLPPAEERRLVELARAPWRAGGPTMRRTADATLPEAVPLLPLRIHEPEGALSGTLVYVHGGGWTMFNLETHDRLMREYAARAGMAVVGLDYALTPEAVFPTAIGQVVHALRRLREEPQAFGLPPGPIFIGDDSAGANLAMAAALVLRDAGAQDLLSGLVLNYGVYDSACTGRSFAMFTGPAYTLTREEMLFFWGRYLPDEAQRTHPLASLLHADLRGLPPCFLAIADCDVLADENQAMAERLREAQVAVEAVTYPGTTHSFLEAVSVARVAARAFQDQAEWMRSLAERQ